MISRNRTVIGLFERSAGLYKQNPMFWEKPEEVYKSSSYGEMQEQIYWFACGLLKLGIEKGDKLALLAQARKDWVIAELGILYSGAINVPLSVKLESDDLYFRLDHSEAKVLVTSAFQYPKLKSRLGKLEKLELVILLDPMESYEDFEVYMGDLLGDGKKFYKENQDVFKKSFSSIKEHDCALISYTSGTTADPKGIMLSHKNLFVNCEQSLDLFEVKEDFRNLLILPLDHSFAHTTGMYVFLASGASLASVKVGRSPTATLKNVFSNIQEIKPDALLSVPTVAKNMRKNIENGIHKKGRMVNYLFGLGLTCAYQYFRNGWNKGTGFRWVFYPLYKIIDMLVFSAVRKSFGGRLKYFVGGGALLDIELQRFFLAIGMPMYQGYGLSEASPVISSNTIKNHKLGSSGKIVPNLEVTIRDEQGEILQAGQTGEIVIRGENVMMGYFRNEAATNDAIRNGWLLTGDMGYFDKDGFLYVLGRFKSLLIGDDGEKYSPEGIEEFLEENSNLIQQILVYNNQNPYTSALIYPNVSAIANELNQRGIDRLSERGAVESLLLLRDELAEFRNGNGGGRFPLRWYPTTFAVLKEGFTEENHLLNSTLKMVRGKIINRYKKQIDYLYLAEGKDVLNAENIAIMKNILRHI